MTTLIFGHQNPDTDAITSAMSWAEFHSRVPEIGRAHV